MSWSISIIGKTSNVIAELQKTSEGMEGQTKLEFDSALPHLIGLCKENFERDADADVRLIAAGHGFASNGEQKTRQCSVTLERYYGKVV